MTLDNVCTGWGYICDKDKFKTSCDKLKKYCDKIEDDPSEYVNGYGSYIYLGDAFSRNIKDFFSFGGIEIPDKMLT